ASPHDLLECLVCGRAVDPSLTPWTIEIKGQKVFFDRRACLEAFEHDPFRYAHVRFNVGVTRSSPDASTSPSAEATPSSDASATASPTDAAASPATDASAAASPSTDASAAASPSTDASAAASPSTDASAAASPSDDVPPATPELPQPEPSASL
ncbi:MAG: hypothetical protein ACYCW6_15770, partial [Candidatus Xenobia bacterium]